MGFFAAEEAVPAMVDLHIHLLPDVDDGCDDLEATLAMARAAVADGVTAVAVTPHVNEVYPTTPQQMLAALARTDAAIKDNGIPLAVRPGAEIALDRVDQLSDADLRALSLGGSARYILLECPFSAWPMGLELYTGRLAALGLRTVLAHPERCAGIQAGDGFERLQKAVERGLMVQVNATSLAKRSGKASATAARKLLDAGLIHIVSSDAHDVEHRPPRLSDAVDAIGDAELSSYVTETVPSAVLAGSNLPERPRVQSTRRGGLISRLRR
jgi:protein-tyrosine phosphatase